MFEDSVKDVLAQAFPAAVPDPVLMANAAAEQGRVIRRRRVAVQVAGSSAAVVLVAGAAVALGGGDRPARSPAIAPLATATVPPTPASPKSAPSNNGKWGPPLTANEIIAELAA